MSKEMATFVSERNVLSKTKMEAHSVFSIYKDMLGTFSERFKGSPGPEPLKADISW